MSWQAVGLGDHGLIDSGHGLPGLPEMPCGLAIPCSPTQRAQGCTDSGRCGFCTCSNNGGAVRRMGMGQRTPLIDVVKHTLQSPFLGLPLWQVATATVVGVVLLKYLRR